MRWNYIPKWYKRNKLWNQNWTQWRSTSINHFSFCTFMIMKKEAGPDTHLFYVLLLITGPHTITLLWFPSGQLCPFLHLAFAAAKAPSPRAFKTPEACSGCRWRAAADQRDSQTTQTQRSHTSFFFYYLNKALWVHPHYLHWCIWVCNNKSDWSPKWRPKPLKLLQIDGGDTVWRDGGLVAFNSFYFYTFSAKADSL